MKTGARSQESEVRSQELEVRSGERLEAEMRNSKVKSGDGQSFTTPSFIIHHSSFRILFLLTSVFWLLTPSFAATHVIGAYSIPPNSVVMTTVNGNAEYGLIFAQRNKPVTYKGTLYFNNVVNSYLDINGNINDGNGNQWIDLIPDANATPSDSYYVVTINIQGSVHSEIWIVPDQASINVASIIQPSAPPSGGSAPPTFFYQTLQQSGTNLTQRPTLNLSGSGVSCLDNSGLQRTDCTIIGGSSNTATPTVPGTVETDQLASMPVVYLQSSVDSLLAGKVATTRQVLTTSPLTGGALASDLALSLPVATSSQNGYLASADWATFNSKQNTVSVTTPVTLVGSTIGMVNQGTATTLLHGNAAGNPTFGPVALTTDVSGILPLANGGTGSSTQNFVDLTTSQTVGGAKTYSGKHTLAASNSGAASLNIPSGTAPAAPVAGDFWNQSGTVKFYDGSVTQPLLFQSRNVNTSSPLGGGGALTSDLTLSCPSCVTTVTAISPLSSSGGTSPAISVANQNANLVLAGPSSGGAAAPAFRALVGADLPLPGSSSLGGVNAKDCTGTGHVLKINTDGTVTCSADSGGGATTVNVNGSALAASTGNLSDSTPAAPASTINVKWQKDALSPTNISANVAYATGSAPGVMQLAADLSGSATSPQVVSTHLAAALPLSQGGTGVTAAQGNGTKVQLSTGSTTANDCIKFDANGNDVDSGGGCPAIVSSAGVGGFFGVFLNLPQGATATTTAFTANQVRVFQFVIPYSTKIGHMIFNISTLHAGGHCDFGIYDSSGGSGSGGNLLLHTGSVSTGSAGVNSTAITPVTLNPGIYYLAYVSDDTTVVFSGNSSPSAAAFNVANQNAARAGTAANAAAAGFLPASTGTLTGSSSLTAIPVSWFEP
jgi:hypothetical protein